MMRPEPVLAGVALAAGVGLLLVPQPDVDEKMRMKATELSAKLDSRQIHLDPAEVNVLLHDGQVITQLIDVRSEADFNLFHLVDAQRLSLDDLRTPEVQATLNPKALKIFVANGEPQAEAAWKIVTASGINDAYVLAGGLDLWLSIYRDRHLDAAPRTSGDPAAALARFERALGDRYPYARPSLHAQEGREFEEKAKRLSKVSKPAGGCGG